MRKLAILTTAMLGLALAIPSFAQPSQSAPQTGLPPGAGIGAQNAQPPRASGEITTTTPAPMAAPAPVATSTPPATTTRRVRRARRRAARRAAHQVAPATATPPAAQ